MHLTRIRLAGFRSYTDAEFDLEPGVVVFTGPNGAGKSSLLEAVHMLSVAKSTRARTDREIVNHSAAQEGGHAQVTGIFRQGSDSVRAQFDIDVTSVGTPPHQHMRVRSKEWRINGVRMKALEFVGRTNTVLFEARDLDLILGGAAPRRRYLNMLISQFDSQYLRALTRIEHIRKSRNALLRGLYEGADPDEEMPYWNERFRDEALKVIQTRREVMAMIHQRAAPIYAELSGGETLSLEYEPNLGTVLKEKDFHALDVKDLRQTIYDALMMSKPQESAVGRTVIGPHLDDFMIRIRQTAARQYASRGQARTAALSLRLAEAALVDQFAARSPIIAFDDVMSEMDAKRRSMIIARAEQYEQTLMTATDNSLIDDARITKAKIITIRNRQTDIDL